MSSKSNRELGVLVNDYLTSKGLQTPTIAEKLAVSDEEKIAKIAPLVAQILETLGLDLSDDSLQDTPNRVAKMYVKEIYSGLVPDNFPKCTAIDNKMFQGEEVVLEKNLTMFSSCEHHLVTIQGKNVAVAYVPHSKVIGLSKLNRIVQYFAKRPQVEERLTHQIAHVIAFVTQSPDVLVYIDAEHFCVKQRGIGDTTSSTVTLAALGAFEGKDNPFRKEVLDSIR